MDPSSPGFCCPTCFISTRAPVQSMIPTKGLQHHDSNHKSLTSYCIELKSKLLSQWYSNIAIPLQSARLHFHIPNFPKFLVYHWAKEDQRQDAAMDEMFVEFFDAIDDLSDNEQLEGTSGSHGIKGSLVEVSMGNDMTWPSNRAHTFLKCNGYRNDKALGLPSATWHDRLSLAFSFDSVDCFLLFTCVWVGAIPHGYRCLDFYHTCSFTKESFQAIHSTNSHPPHGDIWWLHGEGWGSTPFFGHCSCGSLRFNQR